MKTLGTILENKTSETLTKAEQLNTVLNKLNVLIEGKLAFYSFSLFLLLPLFSTININNLTFRVFKCLQYMLIYMKPC